MQWYVEQRPSRLFARTSLRSLDLQVYACRSLALGDEGTTLKSKDRGVTTVKQKLVVQCTNTAVHVGREAKDDQVNGRRGGRESMYLS